MDIVQLPMALIDEDTDQPRYQFDQEALQELMNSIQELGLLSPIKVRTVSGGRYKIVYGNRRYKACSMLGLATIPCIVSNATDEMEIYLEQIAENLTREGFSPIEEAEAFDKLLNDPRFKSSTKFLSSKLGKPESYIKNKCELLKFGSSVKKLIISGTDITKDRLTEEQLMPLKDMPIEHRDPLALIAARDELPVSDVKKIAKLFKDPGIPASTKDKLLYKNGPGLIETWSVYQQTKAERAKPAEAPKAAAKKEAAAQAAEPSPSHPGEPLQPQATPIERSLAKLLAAIPAHAPLSPEAIQSVARISPENQAAFLAGMDTLIVHLENHLAEWVKLREHTAGRTVALD